MFRESDMPEKRMHHSFSDKPVPLMQKLGQNARFDGEFELERNKIGYFKENVPEPIPVTWDTYFDPNNPDADWNGLVQKRAQKKHTNGCKAQHIGLSHSEFGIVGEIQKPPVRLAGVNLRRSDTESLIAGIGTSDQYNTSTQSQFNFESTNMSQMTLARRSAPRPKGLQESYFDPNQSRSNSRTSLYSGAGGDSIYSTMSESGYDNFRDTGISNNNDMRPPKLGTMLSNIGASIFQRVPDINEIQVKENFRKPALPSDYKRSNIRFG